ncbi:MAG TPA: hemerythrin domain-containing protein, partial [Chlamydiales bacterium]|nr:hemerythrin domain-containing protein [Chlamydiales bacterium]
MNSLVLGLIFLSTNWSIENCNLGVDQKQEQKEVCMKSRYKFYREHKYVSFAVNHLEKRIATTDFRNQKEAKKVHREFKELVAMMKGHAHYENSALHTLLKKRGSKVFEQAEHDHEEYDALLLDLEKRLQKVMKTKDEEERVELGYQLYLWFRRFAGFNLLHLHEEETII